MRCSAILPAGSWDPALALDRVELEYDDRHRRRVLLRTASGRDVLLDLPQAARLRAGDGLLLAEGGVVRIEARPEALAVISAPGEGDLVRIAWHLGNRHLPVQLSDGSIRIRADHVIEAMVALLGGHVAHVEAPFDPEAGAYAGGQHHHAGDHHG
jgi:urease accessory protein